MNDIQPYPWQSYEYDAIPTGDIVARVKYCLERSKIGPSRGLEGAWKDEAAKCIPDLLSLIERLRSELAQYDCAGDLIDE